MNRYNLPSGGKRDFITTTQTKPDYLVLWISSWKKKKKPPPIIIYWRLNLHEFMWLIYSFWYDGGKQWISPRNETQLASGLPCLRRHCGRRQQNKQANERVRAKMNVCQINWRAAQRSGGEGRGKVVLKVNICTRWVLATCSGLRTLLNRKQTCYFTQA